MNRNLKNSRFAHSAILMAGLSCMIEAAGAADVGAPRQPVEYIVQERSLIGNEIHEAGARVMYDGLPADNLKPVDAEGRARAEEFKVSNDARVKKMIELNQESAVGDATAFAAAFAKELVAQKAEADAKFAALQEQNSQVIGLLATLVEKIGAAPAPAAVPEVSIEKSVSESAGTEGAATESTTDTTAPAKRTRGS